MSKFLIPLGVIAMLATPGFAAAPKHVIHKQASHATCVVKGKEVPCPMHAMRHARHHVNKAPAVYRKK